MARYFKIIWQVEQHKLQCRKRHLNLDFDDLDF